MSLSRLLFSLPLLLCLGLAAGGSGSAGATTFEGVVAYVDSAECYVVSAGRTSGVRVIGPTSGVAVGDAVSVSGTAVALDGENSIQDATVTVVTSGSAVKPLGVSNRWLGGATPEGQPALLDRMGIGAPGNGWQPAVGTPNTGLLVTIWGRINAVYQSLATGASWFYVDDGSGMVSDCGDIGVLVYSEAAVERGQFVSVTGISSLEVALDEPARLIRVIRTRSTDDVCTCK